MKKGLDNRFHYGMLALLYQPRGTLFCGNCSAGGAGGRSPPAGVWGVPSSFPSFPLAAYGGMDQRPEKLLSALDE